MNGDNVSSLPTTGSSDSQIHPHLQEFLDNVEEDKGSFSIEVKELAIIVVIFAVLASGYLDNHIVNMSPICKTPTTMLIAKSIVFALVYYIIHNSEIIKKN